MEEKDEIKQKTLESCKSDLSKINKELRDIFPSHVRDYQDRNNNSFFVISPGTYNTIKWSVIDKLRKLWGMD
jgi:hypothetical protein